MNVCNLEKIQQRIDVPVLLMVVLKYPCYVCPNTLKNTYKTEGIKGEGDEQGGGENQ
jgi:hypothetical protein